MSIIPLMFLIRRGSLSLGGGLYIEVLGDGSLALGGGSLAVGGGKSCKEMATKHLAKQLGLIRRSSVSSLSSKNPGRPKCRQLFDYLIIIDFESTCWKDTKHFGQEIIEFPAVLLNTTNGEVESEFHTYVQPQEHPILSEFCTELTGIKQDQVEQGVPLKICLSQFCSWIQRLQTEKKIVFLSAVMDHSSLDKKLCTFVTWSDWDLEVCLLYECKRKQLRKPDILNSWIDLRATYKLFYDRKPKGLNGALQDLGITFSGREHSGLDDSRNTARLAWRMICDGCLMKITKSLDKVCPKMNFAARAGIVIPVQSNTSRNDDVDEASNKGTVCGKNYLDLRNDNDLSKTIENCREKEVGESTNFSSGNHYAVQLPKCDAQTDHSTTQSLLSPQTVINGLSAPLCQRRLRPSYCNSSMNMTNGIQVGSFSSTSNNTSVLGSGLVFVSTTISSVNNGSDLDVTSSSECLSMLADWEDVAVIQESQPEQNIETLQPEETTTLSTDSFDSGTLLKSSTEMNFYKIFDNRKQTKVHTSPSRTHSIVYKSPNTTIYNVGEVNKQACSSFKLPGATANHSSRLVNTKPSYSPFNLSEPVANSLSPINKHACTLSKLPETMANHSSRLSNAKQSCSTFKLSQPMANSSSMINRQTCSTSKLSGTSNNSSRLTNVSNVVQKSKCSTMLPYFPKRKLSTTPFFSPPKKQPFTVHKDIVSNASLPLTSSHAHTVPSAVLNSSVNANQSFKVVNNGKITPPLCNCGRRSKRLTVSSIGPNQGRAFYSCPVGKRAEGKKKGCGYFKWDQTLVKEKSAISPSLSIVGGSFASRGTSFITSDGPSSSQKRSLGLRPSMRM